MLGSILGAGDAKAASRSAQAAQVQGMQNAINAENTQFGQTQQAFAPYTSFGTTALGPYGDLLGVNGATSQQTAIDALKNSPYYQSLYNNGQQTVLQNSAATGGLRGGNAQASLYNLGTDTLSSAIQQQLQNLGGAVNLGYGATNQLANYGQANANTLAQLLTGQGQANAQGILQRGNIRAGMWGSLGSGLDSILSDVATGGLSSVIPGLGSLFQGGGGGQTLGSMGGYNFSGLPGMFSGL
jgi:hypothetical protein